ncbi:MAG: helicase HerA-like domain-containing protein, partial [Pseudomonadota bacterium]
KGAPSMVERTLVRPPSSRLGPAIGGERAEVMEVSPVSMKYDEAIDRESAYEILSERELEAAEAAEKLAKEEEEAKQKVERSKSRRRSTRQTPIEAATKQASRTFAREFTKYVLRGILGGRRR